MPVAGALLHVDLTRGLMLPVTSDKDGETMLTTGYPAAAPAAPVYVQYAWPASNGTISASDALRIQ